MKKSLWVLFISILVLVIGFITYLVYQQYQDTLPTIPSQKNNADSFPSSDDLSRSTTTTSSPSLFYNQLNLIVDIPLFDYWLDDVGNLYIITPDGRISFKDNEEYVFLTTQTLPDIHLINTSFDGKNVLVIYNFPYDPIFTVFHTETATWTPLPVKIESADWHPHQSNEIIYLSQGSLSIFNITTGKSKKIMNLNILDVDLEWRTPDTVLITEKPSATIRGSSWIIQLSTQKINKLYQEKGLIIRSNDNLELRSFIGLDGPQFILADVHSGLEITQSKTLFTTLQSQRVLSDKCAFDDFTIYCAVPQFIPSKIQYPDDYFNRSFYTHDIFYEASTIQSHGLIGSRKLYISDDPIDAYHLSVSNNFLYFINRINKKLYRISLD